MPEVSDASGRRAAPRKHDGLDDGGNIALTAQSDKHTTHRWSGLLGPRDLSALEVTDFQVISHGALIPWADDCVRD